MTCQDLVELVTDYLEGVLDQDTRVRFEAHLADCEGCATYLEQMGTTLTLLGSIPTESLAPPVRERMLAALRGVRGTG